MFQLKNHPLVRDYWQCTTIGYFSSEQMVNQISSWKTDLNEWNLRNFSTSSLCLWWPGCCRLLSWSLVTLSSSSSFSEGFVSESWIEKHSKYILDLNKVVNYQPLLTMIFSSQLCPELRCRRSGEYLMNLIKIKYLFRITGVLVVGFIICWTPYNVMSLWWVTKHYFRHVYLIEGGG